jgi:hypothetical protein
MYRLREREREREKEREREREREKERAWQAGGRACRQAVREGFYIRARERRV